jgi:hypothetical protein
VKRAIIKLFDFMIEKFVFWNEPAFRFWGLAMASPGFGLLSMSACQRDSILPRGMRCDLQLGKKKGRQSTFPVQST